MGSYKQMKEQSQRRKRWAKSNAAGGSSKTKTEKFTIGSSYMKVTKDPDKSHLSGKGWGELD